MLRVMTASKWAEWLIASAIFASVFMVARTTVLTHGLWPIFTLWYAACLVVWTLVYHSRNWAIRWVNSELPRTTRAILRPESFY